MKEIQINSRLLTAKAGSVGIDDYISIHEIETQCSEGDHCVVRVKGEFPFRDEDLVHYILSTLLYDITIEAVQRN